MGAAPVGGGHAFTELFVLCATVLQNIANLPKPSFAEVHGIATAAGFQLAASCDLAVAAEEARFGINGVTIGLFCSTPLKALSRKISPSAAFEFAATGEFLTAADAQTLGLVNRLATADTLRAQTMQLAQTLAQRLPIALNIGKSAFAPQTGLPLDKAYAAAGTALVENLRNDATAEGITAFHEKRLPDWP